MITDAGLDPAGIGARLDVDTITPTARYISKVPMMKPQLGVYKIRDVKPLVCIGHLVFFFLSHREIL